jgi:CDP-glycerol glycerophosphotransferase (TagB/SpsB family)
VCIDTDDVIPILKQADIMVSDTSSIISEFLLLRKPVVTFKNRAPGPHLLNIDDPAKLEDTIALGLSRPKNLMAAVQSYADRIHPFRDGRSSIRVLAAADSLADRGITHLKAKPFNLIRRLKIRRQLGYYRF